VRAAALLPERLRGFRLDDSDNYSDLLRANQGIMFLFERFADCAGVFPLRDHDEIALVQPVLAVIVSITEGHYASPAAAGARRMSLRHRLAGILRRRCEDYALKAMAYLMILREVARPGRRPNPMSGSFEVVAGEPLFLSTLIHIAEGKRDRGH